MENLVVNPEFWRGKNVLLTGHTGFKGSWLAIWLKNMQANVFGLALSPATKPSLFELAGIENLINSKIGDITDLAVVRSCFQESQPEIVIHLAAQPLVRYGYLNPLQTYQTNVLGSLNVLECIRESDSVKAVVMVTTDKCYENREWLWSYRENDMLGGYDPYSSSKACMELLVAAYRQSYFGHSGSIALATVRAGNVIGGGDWAEDRLLPDLIRAVTGKQTLIIRNPQSIRPWQHVLEPLSGYLRLAERLFSDGPEFAEAWNFGPDPESAQNVQWIVEHVTKYWPDLKCQIIPDKQLHEAHVLKLDCSKAQARLSWRGRWQLPEALTKTLDWYQQQMAGANMHQFTLKQIAEYEQMAGSNG